jgi:predicted MPP superfamily phosphohydrolase
MVVLIYWEQEMRKRQVILFVTVIIGIYTFLNYYLFTQGQLLITGDRLGRIIYMVIFWLWALSYPAGRILERLWFSKVSDILVIAGSYWMAVMLYFFLGTLVGHLIAIAARAVIPGALFLYLLPVAQIIYLLTVAATLLIIVYGSVNARLPVVKKLDLHISKKTEKVMKVHLVVVSDIHLGRIVSRQMAHRIIRMINAQQPDIVLLAGDVVDEDLAPVIRLNLGECLDHLKARWGVYAITGNHEYIGGAEQACSYLEAHGIRVLRDEWVKLENGLYLAGREDRDKQRFTGVKRKPLEEIMKDIDLSYPVVMLDHQPFDLYLAERNGVDLSLSGHTHHGQIWPLNYITSALYELSWGYKKRGNTHYYVSCGAGTWGPPLRVGNRPEIVDIRLTISDI